VIGLNNNQEEQQEAEDVAEIEEDGRNHSRMQTSLDDLE
jgi:hypothetical protein